MKLKQKYIVKASIFILLFGFGFTHFYMPRFITEIKNPFVELIRTKAKFPQFKDGKEIKFKSEEGFELSAHITYSKLDSTKATIILIHGIRSQKEYFIGLSENLSKQGFNSVAIDLRAHGNSQGTHCTFGVKEKNDIKLLVDYLIEKENIKTPIGIWGQSLGGAVALQSLAHDKRIHFGIVESTFSEFKPIVQDYFKHFLGFNIPIFTNYLMIRAGKIADFKLENANPIDACSEIYQPILLVHGDNDTRIDIENSFKNFEQIKSEKKEHLIIEKANHLNVWEVGGNAYFNHVFEFINVSIY